MIWDKIKIEKTKNITMVKNECLNNSNNDVSVLLAYQRKIRGKFKYNEAQLPKLNFFNPRTKVCLKKNLIKFLAQNKSIKPKEFYQPPTPKKNMKKFFREYQQEIFKKKIERMKKFSSRLGFQENDTNQLGKNNELKPCFSKLKITKNNKDKSVRSSSVDKIICNNRSMFPYI